MMPDTDMIAHPSDENSPESSAVSNGVSSYDTWEEARESWTERVTALMDEMSGYGFASVFVSCAVDQIQGTQSSTCSTRLWRGNYFACLGLLVDTQRDMMNGDV